MLFLYILLCCSVYSIDIKPIKQCVNCKHFRLNHPLSNPENGKCVLYPMINTNKKNLFSRYVNEIDFEKCIVVRNKEEMCGKDGKYYEDRNGNHEEMNEFVKKIKKCFRKMTKLIFLNVQICLFDNIPTMSKIIYIFSYKFQKHLHKQILNEFVPYLYLHFYYRRCELHYRYYVDDIF